MEERALTLNEAYTVSADAATEEVYRSAANTGAATLFDRWKQQQPQCRFGQEGICCHICGMGPCRIHPKAERGVCGATAETIVARNMLRHIVAGTAAYIHQAKRAAGVLKDTADGRTGFSIKDETKLKDVAKRLGLDEGDSISAMAKGLAAHFLEELNKPVDTPSTFVTAFAPEKRLKVWENLGVIPGGPQSELLGLWRLLPPFQRH